MPLLTQHKKSSLKTPEPFQRAQVAFFHLSERGSNVACLCSVVVRQVIDYSLECVQPAPCCIFRSEFESF